MSLYIQTNVITHQNQISFKSNIYEKLAWEARTLAKLGGPKIEATAETFLQKIIRNNIYGNLKRILQYRLSN